AAVPLHDRGNQPLELFLAPRMSGDRLGTAREAGVDSSRLDVEAFLLAARKHDLGALFRQRLGDRAADATAGSGHERDAPGQVAPGARGHGRADMPALGEGRSREVRVAEADRL